MSCFPFLGFLIILIDSFYYYYYYCCYCCSCQFNLFSEPALLHFDLARCRTLGNFIESKLGRATWWTLVLAVIQRCPGFGAFCKYVSAIFANVVTWTSIILGFTEKEKLSCCSCRRRSAWSDGRTPKTDGGEGRRCLGQQKCSEENGKEAEKNVGLHHHYIW